LSPDSLHSAEPGGALSALPLTLAAGLVLHPTTAHDAPEAFAVIDAERDRLREWLPWVDDTVDVAGEREFLRTIELANEAGIGLHATIRVDGLFGGFIGLRLNDLHRSAEVGYWLAEHGVGRGVMTRSVVAMFDIAFGRLDMHRVELLAATGNARSRAIAVRLGMTFEGVRREAEELARGFVDLAMYAVLADDWYAGAAARERLVAGLGKPANGGP
jgi:ribosomal-protein-serine acetyltransferase